jgi:hypothetical protein
VLNLTLDHNCLINLENETSDWLGVKRLIDLHHAGVVRVHVGLISASENVKGGSKPSHRTFAEWIERLGLSKLPQVLPEARVGMSDIGFSVIAGDDDLDKRVRAIIHPSAEVDYQRFATEKAWPLNGPVHPKWRNMACDVDGMVAHIRQGHHVFVTEDRHFLNKRDSLRLLGGEVLTPSEAVGLVSPHG